MDLKHSLWSGPDPEGVDLVTKSCPPTNSRVPCRPRQTSVKTNSFNPSFPNDRRSRTSGPYDDSSDIMCPVGDVVP